MHGFVNRYEHRLPLAIIPNQRHLTGYDAISNSLPQARQQHADAYIYDYEHGRYSLFTSDLGWYNPFIIIRKV